MRSQQNDSGTDLGFCATNGLEGILDDMDEGWMDKDEICTRVGVLVCQFCESIRTVDEGGTETCCCDALQEDRPDDAVWGEDEDGGWVGLGWVCEGGGEVVQGIRELEGV